MNRDVFLSHEYIALDSFKGVIYRKYINRDTCYNAIDILDLSTYQTFTLFLYDSSCNLIDALDKANFGRFEYNRRFNDLLSTRASDSHEYATCNEDTSITIEELLSCCINIKVNEFQGEFYKLIFKTDYVIKTDDFELSFRESDDGSIVLYAEFYNLINGVGGFMAQLIKTGSIRRSLKIDNNFFPYDGTPSSYYAMTLCSFEKSEKEFMLKFSNLLLIISKDGVFVSDGNAVACNIALKSPHSLLMGF